MLDARVLLVYGYEPSGHSAAAFAIEEAGRKAGLVFSTVEVARDHHPAAGPAMARGYHALFRAAPGAWHRLYHGRRVLRVLRAVRSAYLDLGGGRRLAQAIGRLRPDVIVSTQASVAAVLSEARRRGDVRVPVVSVLTDYGVHPSWADPPADMILAPDERSCRRLRLLGVDDARLRKTGIPIRAAFAETINRALARRMLALPPSAPVILASGGGKGLGALEETALSLLRRCPRAHLLVLCGSNDSLRRSLSRRRESGERLRVFGPQPPGLVAAMMSASDLHLGKPGGLSVAESMAMGLPMILTQPSFAQERENAKRLTRAGAALVCLTTGEAAMRARELLDDVKSLAALRAAAVEMGNPLSATRVCAEIAHAARRSLATSC
ncbi:MAG: glycosyltransferase [Elusimicrobiota bacterium]